MIGYPEKSPPIFIYPLVVCLLFITLVSQIFAAPYNKISSSDSINSILPACQPPQLERTFVPAKDNTLFEISDHHVDVLSNGSGKYLFVGATVSHGIRRAILAFDLSIYNFLPGATVISTTLGLNHSSPGESTSTISLHKLVTDWGESASDAGEPGGDGAPASLGDATWLHSFYDDSFWNAEGGDFVQTASATQTVGIESVTFIWGSTQMMVEDVQGWIQNPGSNYGWILIGNEDVPGTAKRFDSRENTSANQPKLIVHYTYPTFTNCRYLPMVNK